MSDDKPEEAADETTTSDKEEKKTGKDLWWRIPVLIVLLGGSIYFGIQHSQEVMNNKIYAATQ